MAVDGDINDDASSSSNQQTQNTDPSPATTATATATAGRSSVQEMIMARNRSFEEEQQQLPPPSPWKTTPRRRVNSFDLNVSNSSSHSGSVYSSDTDGGGKQGHTRRFSSSNTISRAAAAAAAAADVSITPKVASSSDSIGRVSSHSQTSAAGRWSDVGATSLTTTSRTDTNIDDSTHSNSSVREIRRSILAQNPQVPPAFRNNMVDRSPSPKGRNVSYSSEDSESPQKPRRSRRPPRPSFNAAAEDLPKHSASSSASSQPPRPPSRNLSNDRTVAGRSSPSLALPFSSDHNTTPTPEGVISVTSGALPVNILHMMCEEDGGGDTSKVSTYNAILESMIANSDNTDNNPLSAQKGLDVLATMEQYGVTPDETTWKLIDRFSHVQNINTTSNRGDESDGEEDAAISGRGIQKFSLYSSERVATGSGGDGAAVDLSPSKGPKKPWRMEQDLSKLPPAFRTSILAMLRRNKGYRDVPVSPIPVRKPVPMPIFRAPSPGTITPQAIGPSVSDRKKLFLPNDILTGGDDDEEDKTDNAPSESSSTLKPAASGEPKTTTFAKIFAEHGVIQYMRPDGLGKAARRKRNNNNISDDKDDDSASASYLSALEEIDISPSAFQKLLSSIANSGLPDRANIAGKVLKRMKSNSMTIDEKTLRLLVACTRIPQPPLEPKPHELEMVDEIVEATEEDAFTTPTQLVKKRVRFADTNSFRFIRRRRSIGSNERWDDPLTPPKRVSEPVDLAPGRFSSGLRDDRPALPRRSISTGSWHSMSSQSERSSSSSSDTIDSMFEEDSPVADRFKLPLTDSPEAKERKLSARKSTPEGDGRPPRKPSDSSPKPPGTSIDRRLGGGTPTAPVRSYSNDDTIFLSPPTPRSTPVLSDDPRFISSAIPPPPIDDPKMYRTPSPRPRLFRRRSISGIERRANFPLTPPRRVSAPLELFIAQEALKAKQRAENEGTNQNIKKDDSSKIVKAMASISIASISPGSTSSLPAENPPAVKVSRDKVPVSKPDGPKPPLPASPLKANRVGSISQDAASENPIKVPVRQVSLPKSKPTTKTFRSVSETRASQELIRSQSDHTDSQEILTPVGRHQGKMPELWKRMEFDDSDQEDNHASGRWNTIDYNQEQPVVPPADEGRGLRSTSAHDGTQTSQNRRIRPRSAQRQPRSSTGSLPKTKPAEAPSWQRVLKGSDSTSTRKSKSTERPPRSRISMDRPSNASYHGTRTIFADEKDKSKDMIDASSEKDATVRQEPNKGGTRRASRRNSLPG